MESNSPRSPRRALTPQEIAARLPAGAAAPVRSGALPPLPPAPAAAPAPLQPAPAIDEKHLPFWKLPIPWRITIAVVFLFSLLLFVPWHPVYPGSDLDSSWLMVLHWAFVHHVDFGHDLVFTYGPLGFIWGGYNPATFFWEIAGWTLFAAAFTAGIAQISHRFAKRWWLAGMWLLLVTAMAGVSPEPLDVRLFGLCWLLILIHFYVDDRPVTAVKVLLTVALATATLIKFSTALLAVTAIAFVAIDILRRRRIPWLAGIYLGAVLTLWLAASQPLSGFVPWIYHSWIVASHFASAESGIAKTEARDVTMFIVCAAIFLAALVTVSLKISQPSRRPSARAALGALAVLAALLMAFKEGYVRHDAHETTATTSLALLSLLLVAANWRRFERWLARGLLMLLIVASLSLAEFSYINFNGIGLPHYLISSVKDLPADTGGAFSWLLGRSRAETDLEALNQTIRTSTHLPPVSGTVDVYPWESRLALANSLQFHPRPIIQSYTAYTPVLEEMNAQFLRGPGAPHSILLDVRTLDVRFPTEEDAFSWPELLTRYDIADCTRSILLLERAPQPRTFSIVPIKEMAATANDWIDVPQTNEPIWVSIDIKTTWLGALCDVAYKPPQLYLDVKAPNGNSNTFRLIQDVARGGFLLSPIVTDPTVFVILGSSDWKTVLAENLIPQIRVRIHGNGRDSACFESNYTLRFSELRFPHFAAESAPGRGTRSYIKMQKYFNQMRFNTTETKPSVIAGEDGNFVIYAPAKTQLLLPTPADVQTLRLGFGMPIDTYGGPTASDGVEFRAYAVEPYGAADLKSTLLWASRLDPVNNPDDRPAHFSLEIPLPTPHPQFIMLETVPGPRHLHSRAAWLDIQFK